MNESPKQKIEGRSIYVLVKVHDGTTYRGYFHAPLQDRVQDLLNDHRNFIPLRITHDTDEVVLLSKQYIVSIEEIKDKTVRPFSF